MPEEIVEDWPDDFPEQILQELLTRAPPLEAPDYLYYDEYLDGGDWWNNYYDWWEDDYGATYFEAYDSVSEEIHYRIANEGLVERRAGSNATLDINFQLFIKDVTNLQQEGFEINLGCPQVEVYLDNGDFLNFKEQ